MGKLQAHKPSQELALSDLDLNSSLTSTQRKVLKFSPLIQHGPFTEPLLKELATSGLIIDTMTLSPRVLTSQVFQKISIKLKMSQSLFFMYVPIIQLVQTQIMINGSKSLMLFRRRSTTFVSIVLIRDLLVAIQSEMHMLLDSLPRIMTESCCSNHMLRTSVCTVREQVLSQSLPEVNQKPILFNPELSNLQDPSGPIHLSMELELSILFWAIRALLKNGMMN